MEYNQISQTDRSWRALVSWRSTTIDMLPIDYSRHDSCTALWEVIEFLNRLIGAPAPATCFA
jgi:hypothetical protein